MPCPVWAERQFSSATNSSASLATLPPGYRITHRLAGILLHPGHEAKVEFEMIATTRLEIPTNILRGSL